MTFRFLAVSEIFTQERIISNVRSIASLANLSPITVNVPTGWTLRCSPNEDGPKQSNPFRSFSLRKNCIENTWVFGENQYGLCPFFFSHTDSHLIVSSDPVWIAASTNSSIDLTSLYQDIVVGHRVGSRTIFENVFRLDTNETAMLQPGGTLERSIDRTTNHFGPTTLEDTADKLVDCASNLDTDNTMLELTGGVDSRLNLATLIAANRKPKFAMTLGEKTDPDVVTAGLLSKLFAIQHIVINPTDRKNTDLSDVRQFVENSLYSSNAINYGWLPSIFRTLNNIRPLQITGAGGEYAGGFYKTPLDRLCFSRLAQRQWVQRRLLRLSPGTSVFSTPAHFSFAHTLIDDCVHRLNDLDDDWVEAGNKWYLEHRLRQWAAPVLWASDHWYTVQAPLLSPMYLDWCKHNRSGRAGQIELARKLHSPVLAIPFANYYPRQSIYGQCRTLSRKIASRTIRKAPKRSRIEHLLAAQLASDKTIHSTIDCLIQLSPKQFAYSSGQELAQSLQHTPSTLGAVITAAFAHHRFLATQTQARLSHQSR